MTSTQTPTPTIVRITNHLPLFEKLLLIALAIGMILTVMEINTTLTRVALLGLAFVFFLSAFRLIEIPREENEEFTFSDMLGYLIAPKVLWISSAVSAMGIALYFFGNEGYKQMLLIGGSTIAMATLLLLSRIAGGLKHAGLITPILLRALPLLAVDIYLFFNS